tara:strand:+ start:109 stop:516 length:408 start_codon:yes stop_codon:yes gene_type:complete
MSITTTGIMKDQLMREPLDTTPEVGMEGGVNRPSIVSDLMEAMKDLDFRQLMEQYAAMSGQSVAASRPLTNQLMQEEMPTVQPAGINVPPIDGQTDLQQAVEGSQMPGVPVTPVIKPEDIMKQNLGLMQQPPMEA